MHDESSLGVIKDISRCPEANEAENGGGRWRGGVGEGVILLLGISKEIKSKKNNNKKPQTKIGSLFKLSK